MIDIILIQLSMIFGIIMVVVSLVAVLAMFLVLSVVGVSMLAVIIWVAAELANDAWQVYMARQERIQDENDRKQIEREQEARRVASIHTTEDQKA